MELDIKPEENTIEKRPASKRKLLADKFCLQLKKKERNFLMIWKNCVGIFINSSHRVTPNQLPKVEKDQTLFKVVKVISIYQIKSPK